MDHKKFDVALVILGSDDGLWGPLSILTIRLDTLPPRRSTTESCAVRYCADASDACRCPERSYAPPLRARAAQRTAQAAVGPVWGVCQVSPSAITSDIRSNYHMASCLLGLLLWSMRDYDRQILSSLLRLVCKVLCVVPSIFENETSPEWLRMADEPEDRTGRQYCAMYGWCASVHARSVADH